jgi:hypothetical protein
MDHPLLIISNAISDGDRQINPDRAARNAARALTDERIVKVAAQALEDDGAVAILAKHASGIDYEHLARVALRSVGGS